jgi:hypothetical protein
MCNPYSINQAAIIGLFRVINRYVGNERRADDAGARRHHASIEPARWAGVQSRSQRDALGPEKAKEGPMTVLIYVDTNKQVGDKDYLKVFASQAAAETWLQENDPEGVAFEYEVLEWGAEAGARSVSLQLRTTGLLKPG